MLGPSVDVVEIELGDVLPRLLPARGAHAGAVCGARALVRLHGRPLGLVDLPLAPGGLPPDRCAALVWSALRAETYPAKVAADDPTRLVDLAARAPAAVAHARGLSRSRAPRDGRPADLRRLERRGMAGGAAAFARGRLLATRARAA